MSITGATTTPTGRIESRSVCKEQQMYVVKALVDATAPDFPGSDVKWTAGQSRYVHESLIERYRNDPAAWEIVATPDYTPVTSFRNTLSGGIKGGTLSSDPSAFPRILIVGDSTVVYAYAVTSAPTAAVGNANGTVTVQFSSTQGLQVGDRIGFTDGANVMKFCATEAVVTEFIGTGPYFYTFTPDETPTVGAHPTPANSAVVYLDRGSIGSFVTDFKALLGAGFDIIVAGNGGDTIDVIKARLPALLARFAPTHVILTHGINDCYGTALTVSDVIARYQDINYMVSKAGAALEIVGPPPQPSTRTNWSTAKRNWMRDFRAAQADWCKTAQVDYTDWWACAAGSTQAVNPTDANANPSTSIISTDLVHPALAGSYLLGKSLATKYRARYPSDYTPLPQSILDGGILTNPLFTGTAGTRTNGTGTVAAGDVADTYDVTVATGTATATPYQTARTVADDGDICGNWQGATMVAVAGGDRAAIRTAALHTIVTNGSNYRLTCEVKLKTGASLCKELSLSLVSQTNTTGNKTYLFRSVTTTNATPHPEAAVFVFDQIIGVRGPQSVHGSPTLFRPQIQCVANAAGTIEFEVSRLSIVAV